MNPIKVLEFAITFALTIALISCHGQDAGKSKIIKKESLSSNDQKKSKDPMFFLEGQLCQHVRKIFQDSRGDLWFGTNVYGLMKYDGISLEYLDGKKGMDYGRCTGILEDKKGNVWFGTYHGLLKYDGASFTLLTEKDGLLNNEIWCLTFDSKENIWIGTNKGVSIFDGTEFKTLEIPKPEIQDPKTIYDVDRIVSISADEKGNMWFGTDGFGLSKYDGKSFTNFTTDDGLADNVISELMFDAKGNLWIGTYFGGLSIFDGQEFTNPTMDKTIAGVEVGSFFEDVSGEIWFAAENHGVYRYQDGIYKNYYKESGLPTNGILSIYRDQKDRFWFGGWGGLFRLMDKRFVSVTKDGPWKSKL